MPLMDAEGRLVFTHSAFDCLGKVCSIHNPTDHHMASWTQRYRHDTGSTERLCPHNVAHPDPDDARAPRDHACDGCC